MKARINAIEERQTRMGDPFWLVNLDNQKFSLFDAEIGKNLKEGEVVEFTWTENQQGFKKIRTLTKVGVGATAQPLAS